MRKDVLWIGGAGTLLLATTATLMAEPPKLVTVSQLELAARIDQESKGNDWAIGDTRDEDGRLRPPSEWAYGPLQIRRRCVEDVNRYFGTHYRSSQCRGNRSLSIWIFRAYCGIYATREALGHEPTMQDRAGIWNGGPEGWRSWRTRKYRREFAAIYRRFWNERR